MSWEEVQKLNESGITVLSRDVLLNPPTPDGSFPEYNQWGPLLSILTMVSIVAAFAAFEVILLAGAAFTVTARQQQRTLATIASVGAPRKLLFRILAANGIVLGAATGLVPAWALSAVGLPFVPPWLQIAITVVALPLVIACGSWLLATRNTVSARRVAIA